MYEFYMVMLSYPLLIFLNSLIEWLMTIKYSKQLLLQF